MQNHILALEGVRYARRGIDFSSFVDFSTPPHNSQMEPFLVSDISRTITKYSYRNELLGLYKIFPLREIIELVLSISLRGSEVPGHLDELGFFTENILRDNIWLVDIDSLFILYEQLALELDDELTQKSPSYLDCGQYVFYKWYDPISICLRHERYEGEISDNKSGLVIPEKKIYLGKG